MDETLIPGTLWIVSAPSGGGKTQLLRHVTSSLIEQGSVVCCRLLTPDTRTISQYSLISAIVRDGSEALGRDVRSPRSAEHGMQMVRDVARHLQSQGLRLLVVIEEAHGLSHHVYTCAKRIAEASTDAYRGGPRAASDDAEQTSHCDRTFIFCGQTDPSAVVMGAGSLNAYVSDPDHREVVERLTVIDVPPLSPQSLRSYVAFRLARVGASADRLLDDGWWQAVVRALPRERLVPQAVDRLLSDALTRVRQIESERARPRRRLTAEDIDEAALRSPAARAARASGAAPTGEATPDSTDDRRLSIGAA